MELVGGFMVMLSVVGFFLAVLWFILPFVIFAMKGKLDRSHIMLEDIEKRLTAIESHLGMSGNPVAPAASVSEAAPETPLSQSPPPSGGE